VALGVGLPAVLGIVSGSIVIPHNDDPIFRRVALTMYETGRLELVIYTPMTLIGQLAFNAPFLWLLQGSAWAFAISTALLSIIAIVAAYDLARRVLSAQWATFAVLNLLLVPGFLLYTTAFMTDGPAFAGEALCLALGAAALHRTDEAERWRWFIASLVVGVWAFSIREIALAAPAAVLAAGLVSDRRGRWIPYIVAGLGVIGSSLAIYGFMSQLPGGSISELSPFSPEKLETTRRGFGTLGLMLAPSIVVSAAIWIPRLGRSGRWAGPLLGTLGGLAVGWVLFRDELLRLPDSDAAWQVLVGNIFVADGAPGTGALAGGRPVLFSAPIWGAFNVVAVIATVGGLALLGAYGGACWRGVLSALDLRRRDSPFGSVAGQLAIFAIVLGVGTFAFGLLGSMFDRYLWPLVLPLSILLLAGPSVAARAEAAPPTEEGVDRSSRARPVYRVENPAAWLAGGTLLGVLGVASLVLMMNSFAFDAARWRLGEEAVQRGIPAGTVDAGMEWVTFHATGFGDIHRVATGPGMWYTAWWSSFHPCALVSASLLDIPGFRLEAVQIDAYRLLLFAGPESPLYLYRVAGTGCPPA
jgi:hypothetical protein